MIDIGDAVPLEITIKKAGGVPDDAGNVVLTITLPDGTTATPTITHTPGTGVYGVAYLATQAGPHPYRWVATGNNSGVLEDVFTVENPAPALASVAETINEMRLTSVRDADRETLRGWLQLATNAIELDLGIVAVRRTVIEEHDDLAPAGAILLRATPVISVTSVVIEGTAVDPALWRAGRAGIVRHATRWPYSRWRAATVTLVAGYDRPPAVLRNMAMEIVRRLWQQRHQMPQPTIDDVSGALDAISAGARTPGEIWRAYQALRAVGIA